MISNVEDYANNLKKFQQLMEKNNKANLREKVLVDSVKLHVAFNLFVEISLKKGWVIIK